MESGALEKIVLPCLNRPAPHYLNFILDSVIERIDLKKMIAFLLGKTHQLEALKVLMDVQGVGYEVNISLATSESLKKINNNDYLLYTRAIYSENSQSLYGFLEKTEVDLFDFLVSLHGIGPKIVMSILSYCPLPEFLKSLKDGDASMLIKVPGIGKSKSEKIIFEAKSKIKKLEKILSHIGSPEVSQKDSEFMEIIHEALESLGFNQKEILSAEKKILSSETLPAKSPENTQTWIRLFLKLL